MGSNRLKDIQIEETLNNCDEIESSCSDSEIEIKPSNNKNRNKANLERMHSNKRTNKVDNHIAATDSGKDSDSTLDNKTSVKTSTRKRKAETDINKVTPIKIVRNSPSRYRLKEDWGYEVKSLSKGKQDNSLLRRTCETETTTTLVKSAKKNLFLSKKGDKSIVQKLHSTLTQSPESNDSIVQINSQKQGSLSMHVINDSLSTPKKFRTKRHVNYEEDLVTPYKDESFVNGCVPSTKSSLHTTPTKLNKIVVKQIFQKAEDRQENVNHSCPTKDSGRSSSLLKFTGISLEKGGNENAHSVNEDVNKISPIKKSSLSSTPQKSTSCCIKNGANEIDDDILQPLTKKYKVLLTQSPEKEKRTRSPSKSNLKNCETEARDSKIVTPSKQHSNLTTPSKSVQTNITSSNCKVTKKTPLKTIAECPKSYVKNLNTAQSEGISEQIDSVNCVEPRITRNEISQDLSIPTSPLTSGTARSRLKNLATPLQNKNINVITPVSKKKEGRGFLTPSMAKRDHEANETTDNDLGVTRKLLHISTIPKSLPCRETEFSQIKSFLLRKIENSAGGCMYISGVPGTGKTATVHAVIRTLQDSVTQGQLTDFDFVEVNGLRLTEPRQAYVRIYQALSDMKVTPDQAQQLLNKRFSGNCKKSTIVLVDELDYLCNRRQDVVYNILDWPSRRGSALVVLTISNTMDLPERTLKGRVTSRMGLTRLTFQPYTFHQLRDIVQDRLSGSTAFHPDAVQLVARKVAAVSGDARRALDVCRRTTELVKHTGEQVNVSHVEEALIQLCTSARVQAIRGLSGLGQLVLRSVRDVCQRTGVDETTANRVYQHLRQLALLEGVPIPPTAALLDMCVFLVGLGLLVAEKGRPDLTRKISLNVSSDDIHYALDTNH